MSLLLLICRNELVTILSSSQVAILRVRLEELEEELKSKSERLAELESDRNRILQDHSDSSGLHSQALESLKVPNLYDATLV